MVRAGRNEEPKIRPARAPLGGGAHHRADARLEREFRVQEWRELQFFELWCVEHRLGRVQQARAYVQCAPCPALHPASGQPVAAPFTRGGSRPRAQPVTHARTQAGGAVEPSPFRDTVTFS